MNKYDFLVIKAKENRDTGAIYKMIYIAGPFFNPDELYIIQEIEKILSDRDIMYFSPRLHDDPEHKPQTTEWSRTIFEMDKDAIDASDIVLVVYHGNYSDTGTAWECGYAYAKGKPVVVVQLGDSSNLMVHESAVANITMEELKKYDFGKLEEKRYSGKMF